MLNYQKNKLLNLILRFELALFDCFDKDGAGDMLVTSTQDEKMDIIRRNVQSIKKQINKL